MQILFVYYSFEGNCRALSRAMSGAVGGIPAELAPVKDDMPRGGFLKYFLGGMRALLKETPEIQPLGVNVAPDSLVVVGGPVWFGRMAPPVRTFLENFDWPGKKAAVFAMHRGGKGSAAKDMAEIVTRKGGTVLSAVNFKDLRKGKAESTLEEAVAWIEALAEKVRTP